MKERSFYSNLFFSLGLNLLVKPAAIFLIDAAVQNEVGSAYGLYFAIFNLSLIFSILFDFGINNLSTKEAAQNLEAAKLQFTSIFSFRIVLMLFYLSVLFCCNLYLRLSWVEYKLILILGLNQFLIANIAYFRSFFAGLQWFRLDAIFSVLDRIMLICSMGYLIYLYPDGFKLVNIESYALMQFGSYALTFIIAGSTIFLKVKPPLVMPKMAIVKSKVKQAFPYALLIVLMTLYTRIDGIILKNLAGVDEASYYAQAYRLIDALYMFAMVFAGLLFPMFSKMITVNPQEIKPLVSQASRLLLGSSIAFIVFSYLQGGLLMDLIYAHPAVDSGIILFLLSIAFFGMASNLIYGSLLTANGSLKALNIISFCGLVFNVMMNLLLIPKVLNGGEVVVAAVAALTQILVALAQAIYCKHLFNLPFVDRQFYKYPLLTYLLMVWYVLVYFSPLGNLNLIWIFLLDVIVSLALLFALKFIDFKELIALVQKRTKAQ
ncbi:MAG: oligosaccharide flippase family protein [Sphingomonadales bacterium]